MTNEGLIGRRRFFMAAPQAAIVPAGRTRKFVQIAALHAIRTMTSTPAQPGVAGHRERRSPRLEDGSHPTRERVAARAVEIAELKQQSATATERPAESTP